MKVSFMTFACPTWPLEAVLNAAETHGYHGIEFRTDADHAHGVEVKASAEERGRIRRELERRGIAACCLATSLQFISDQAVRDAPARVELAAQLGCPALRVFCGPRPEGMSHADMIARTADHLRQAAEKTAPANIQYWLETHDSLCKAADVAAVVRRVNHPRVGINYDNMHPFRQGEDLATTVAALGGMVRHTHFHDAVRDPEVMKITPLGEGDLPMDEMFAALVKMGFTGYLSGEWFGEMYGPDPDTSLARFRQDMTTLAQRHGVRLGN